MQLLKEVSGDFALFGVYDLMLALLGVKQEGRGASRHAHPAGTSFWRILPAGSLAGMAYYAVSYPFDTVKSRLQTDSLSVPRYRGPVHVVQQLLQDQGSMRELYRGLPACLFRAVPGSAIQFVVFELVCALLAAAAHIHASIKPHLANMDHFAHMEHMI
eukprot:SM000077S21583  [mRNA]  locus=s77:298802:299717:- [translate_table: standard]